MRYEALTTPWNALPAGGEVAGHVFAIGDVHGHADLLENMLDHLDLQTSPDGVKRSLIFTGDIVDRGPEQLRSLALALEAKNRFDRRIILPGNHEQMMLDALRNPGHNGNFQFWYKVGGSAMVEEINPPQGADVVEMARIVREALPEGYEDLLLRAPSHHREGPLLFVHAGINPLGNRTAFLAQGIFDHHPDNLHWAWIGEPFINWRAGWDVGDTPKGQTVVVHGHTIEAQAPFEDYLDLARAGDRVSDARRINIDAGSFVHGQLAGLEVLGAHYRLHAVVRKKYL